MGNHYFIKQPAPDLTPENIKSVCFYCWGLLGDVFTRVPIIEAVKKAYPAASITVVVDSYSRKVIETHPDCDEILVYDRKKKSLLRYLINSFKSLIYLRRKKYDVSINLYSGGASAFITRLTNARIRIGFSHTEKLRRANNILVEHPDICQNATKALAELLIPLGIEKEKVRSGTSYYCTSENKEKAKRLLNDNNVRYVAVNLGASTEDKMWPVQNFVELLMDAAKTYKVVPVVFENPGQEYLAHKFERLYQSHGEYMLLTGFKFREEAAVLEQCDVLVTSDTGLLHLSSGVKTPIFAFFLSTRPEPVKPEDCPFHACMIETEEDGVPFGWDKCGWSMVRSEIPVAYAAAGFNNFVFQELGWSEAEK